jgi:hypothetical protein
MYFVFEYSNNHQCFERSVKIYEPLDIEVKKPRICGRHIMRDNGFFNVA